MPDAKAGEPREARIVKQLPSADESAAAIKAATRRLGLLIDLHRIASELRTLDAKQSRPTT
jgi:hypothetical protein